MIHDVDESLRELISRDVLAGAKVDISFEAPSREWAARRAGPALNLYLYDIREDVSRRATHFEEVRDETGRVTERVTPPRSYALSYLVTAWTHRPQDEHLLLSSVLTCFARADALPPDSLRGALTELDRSVGVSVALPLRGDRAVSEVWSALGGELKPSLDLVVTIPLPPGRHFPVGPAVLGEPTIRITGPDGEETAGGRRTATAAGSTIAAKAGGGRPAASSAIEAKAGGPRPASAGSRIEAKAGSRRRRTAAS